ncbi:PLD nuclease N-terminal domain-containing protein [Streptomyces buecherae]|uniref:PLD nuclease N-terminal domain-containing protein n=1 Tax=Streptomyces buecherae TaxID=2763006 RepID=UPI0033F48951
MPHERLLEIAAERQGGDYLMTLLAVIIILVAAGVYISALISIIASSAAKGVKLVWIVFAFIAPVIGSVLWFLVGRRHAQRSPTTS